MNAVVYDSAVVMFARGQADWENDVFKAMLVTDRYQPAQTTDSSREDVQAFEVNAKGYGSGGKPITGRSVEHPSANQVRLSGGSVTWDDFTGEFRYVVVYEPESERLVAVADVGFQRVTGSQVTVDWSRDGVAAWMVAPRS